MNFRKIILVAIIGICASCVSCCVNFMINAGNSRCQIKGNGNVITSEKNVSAFDKVSVGVSAVVRFHSSQEYRTVVSVDENLEEYVEIFTQNNMLNIRTKSGGNYDFSNFQVDVYCPILIGISMSGSGSFENMEKITTSTFKATLSGSGKIKITVDCESFSAGVTGSGKIIVGGNTKDANISISGSGQFRGDEFNISNATVRVSGSGCINVCVADNLKAKISGSGRINYRGEPNIDSKISGSGRIRKM